AQTPIYSYGGGISGTSSFTDDGNGNESLAFDGSQTGTGMLGLTVMMPPGDPTLTINESVNNESSFVWTEYVLDVAMNQTFTISSAAVTAPPGWTETITQPTGPDINGNYNGMIDYALTAGGTPVAIYPALNSILYLGYQINFNSTTSYTVTETATPVPEPGAISLLLVAGLLLGGRMLFKGQRATIGA
ncbi:MAG TPA: hypothetical protein VMA35_01230, partial [Candidatus Sulfopaludibacter sp.]|nr:hypothetical protein [Candidatus Sulfopaludibacter sp.]